MYNSLAWLSVSSIGKVSRVNPGRWARVRPRLTSNSSLLDSPDTVSSFTLIPTRLGSSFPSKMKRIPFIKDQPFLWAWADLNNYIRIHVCLSFHLSVRPPVRVSVTHQMFYHVKSSRCLVFYYFDNASSVCNKGSKQTFRIL